MKPDGGVGGMLAKQLERLAPDLAWRLLPGRGLDGARNDATKM